MVRSHPLSYRSTRCVPGNPSSHLK
jgi:hypothetical protein